MKVIRIANIALATAFLALGSPLMADEHGDGSFELIIQDVTAATNDGTLILGRIKSGNLSVGDTVCVKVYGQDAPVATPVVALNHETMKVDKAEKGWRVEVFVQGLDSSKVSNDGKLTSDC